eukprot:PhF_6_TR28245/c0_g1_i1/m.41773
MPPKASAASRKGAVANAGIGINLTDIITPFPANVSAAVGPSVEQEQSGNTAALKKELTDHIHTLKAVSTVVGGDFNNGGTVTAESAAEQHNAQIASMVSAIMEDPSAATTFTAASNVHSAHPLFHDTTNLTFNFLAKPVRLLVEHHNKSITLRQQRLHLEANHAKANCIRVRLECPNTEAFNGKVATGQTASAAAPSTHATLLNNTSGAD